MQDKDGECYWSVPSEYVTEELAQFCFQVAEAEVMYKGITWNVEPLTIFKSFARIEGTKVVLDNQENFMKDYMPTI